MSTALIVAGIVFGFASFMQLVRLITKAEVRIAGKNIPMWASGVGFIVALSLSVWMFSAAN
ncbi:MAG: hypothetical protein ABI597_11935 [Gammaproteobacteria bacterium]